MLTVSIIALAVVVGGLWWGWNTYSISKDDANLKRQFTQVHDSLQLPASLKAAGTTYHRNSDAGVSHYAPKLTYFYTYDQTQRTTVHGALRQALRTRIS